VVRGNRRSINIGLRTAGVSASLRASAWWPRARARARLLGRERSSCCAAALLELRGEEREWCEEWWG
jgi:hypothetical protein